MCLLQICVGMEILLLVLDSTCNSDNFNDFAEVYWCFHISSFCLLRNGTTSTACPLTDVWMNKKWYLYTMECYSTLKKEENSDTCSKIGEPWRHYAKWNKPGTKGRVLLWFHLYEGLRAVKFIETESIMVVARGWGEQERGIIVKWVPGFSLDGWEMFCRLIVVLVSQQHELLNATVHLRMA